MKSCGAAGRRSTRERADHGLRPPGWSRRPQRARLNGDSLGRAVVPSHGGCRAPTRVSGRTRAGRRPRCRDRPDSGTGSIGRSGSAAAMAAAEGRRGTPGARWRWHGGVEARPWGLTVLVSDDFIRPSDKGRRVLESRRVRCVTHSLTHSLVLRSDADRRQCCRPAPRLLDAPLGSDAATGRLLERSVVGREDPRRRLDVRSRHDLGELERDGSGDVLRQLHCRSPGSASRPRCSRRGRSGDQCAGHREAVVLSRR